MRFARFTILAYGKFEEKRCFMRAAALSFNSLLALVPVLALTGALTSWIIKDTSTQSVEKFVSKIIVVVMPADSSNKDIDAIKGSLSGQITKFIKSLNEQIQIDNVGLISFLLFAYLGLRVVVQMEDTFNELWNVPNPRALYMQILKFSPAIIFFPCCIMIAFTITGSENFEILKNGLDGFLFSWIGKVLLILIPFLFTIAGLTILFKFVPYTNVSWIAAIWGGIIGGILWQLNHLASTLYISEVVINKDFYGKIYGSLGLLPVFMLSVYFSWLIILYGALVAARVQYHSSPLDKTIKDKDTELLLMN
ncbi:YihY/virulence factor BrkB family protein [Verrucomicrobia bacterium]|nr:YihY/virulence factor BrkB family protein [Verrucomicrobiota bacterium]